MPVTPVLEEAAETICCLVNAVSKCQSTFILMIFLYLQTFQWRQKGELSTNYQFWTDLKTKVVVIISYQTKCTLSAGNQFWKSSKQRSIFGRLGDQWTAIEPRLQYKILCLVTTKSVWCHTRFYYSQFATTRQSLQLAFIPITLFSHVLATY